MPISTVTPPPEEIHDVSTGYFSVARLYGGCTFGGARYTYDPVRDVLIRDDVLKARRQAKRLARSLTRPGAPAPRQGV